MTKPAKPIAAAYVRMSTDKQQDSPARQKESILALAVHEGLEVTEWYSDHGKSGTGSKKRPGFQEMMKDAEAGKFTALLMSEQSRMSREDLFQVFSYYKLLRDAGVVIITPQGRLDLESIGGLIVSMVGAHGAHDESRKIADRVVTGKRQAIAKGRRQGGPLIGYDRLIRDPAGKVLCRVHFRSRFIKPTGHTADLVVSSDAKAVRAIVEAYETVANGGALATVQAKLNAAGVTSIMGNKFDNNDVRRLLTNPAYCGTLCHGAHGGTKSKFHRVLEAPVTVADAIPPIVGRDLFNIVQSILGARLHKRTRGKPGQYLLHGLIYCGVCGQKMYGKREYGHVKYSKSVSYRCIPDMRGNPNLSHGQIRAAFVETAIIGIIREKLLSPKGRAFIAERVAKQARKPGPVSPDELRLAELQADIERGHKNLARAEGEADFTAVSRSLADWRKEADVIRSRLSRAIADGGKLTGDAATVVDQLDWLCENFHKAIARPRVSDTLKKVVERIEIKRETVGGFSMWTGAVQFSPDFSDKAYPLPSDWMTRGKLSEVVNYLRESKGQHLVVEIRKAVKTDRGCVNRNLYRAELLGLVEKQVIGKRKHWRAV